MKNKKLVFFIASIFILSIGASILNFSVQADAVSDISVFPGAVNCIVNFTCVAGDSGDTIRIYYDTSSGITTGDDHTYDDPDDCTYGSRTDRKIIIRGLTDSTTYYYRIYNVDETGWVSAEDSFTTLSRFTTEYKDEFFDEYLVEASSDMSLEQQVGTKSGILIDVGTQSWNDGGISFPCIYKESDTLYHLWGSFRQRPLVDDNDFMYMQSTDGVNWGTLDANSENITVVTPANRCLGGTVFYNNTYYLFYTNSNAGSVYSAAVATCTTYNGTFNNIDPDPVLEGQDLDPNADELHPSGMCLDILGANKWNSYGQDENNGDLRECGQYMGFSDTDWIAWNSHTSIPKISGTTPYCFAHMIKSGVYVGFNDAFDTDDTNIRPYLCISRNGYNGWTNFDSSTPIIPLGSSGQWDDEMIHPNWGDPVIQDWDDGYNYIYYEGYDVIHDQGANAKCPVGRIRFRKDGLTAYVPQSNDAWFRTANITGNFIANFTVNGNFTATAKLNISVLNASTGNVYSGFDFTDFDTITTDSISIEPSWGPNNLDDIPPGDFKLNFSFDGTGSGELYSYSMDYGTQNEEIQFISINGGTNGTTIYNSTPVFKWTKANNAIQYNLQIDNNNDFSSPLVNLTDINEINYPSEFQEATNITFILPSSYALETYNLYYTRVRAYNE